MRASYNYSTNLRIQKLVIVVCNCLKKGNEALEVSF